MLYNKPLTFYLIINMSIDKLIMRDMLTHTDFLLNLYLIVNILRIVFFSFFYMYIIKHNLSHFSLLHFSFLRIKYRLKIFERCFHVSILFTHFGKQTSFLFSCNKLGY